MIIKPLTFTSNLTIQGRPVGLFYDEPTPTGISLLPLSSWTIPSKSSSTITVTNDNTLNVNGVGNWNELIYTRFQPQESGTYTLYLKWNAPNGIDFWSSSRGNRLFGMWFNTSLDTSRTWGYEGDRSQGILMYDHDNTSAISLEQTGTLNLNANTNYYVWLSCGTLEDYKLQIFNFTEARLVKV